MVKAVLAAIAISTGLTIIGCTNAPAPLEIEVTREVPVTQQVEITREISVTREVKIIRETTVIREVPVTQQVTVTREVPVTRQVTVTREVPVTRQVEITRETPVTREIPVTRIVTATPQPNGQEQTAMAAATPAATATPIPATPTPEPEALTTDGDDRIGSWELHTRTYGDDEILAFVNEAVQYETASTTPVLTYECRGGVRSVYIDWDQTIATRESNIARRYEENPFKQYYDDDLDALVEYADRLHEFINDLDRLNTREHRDFAEIWRKVKSHWTLSDDTPENFIESMKSRRHREVRIELHFTREKPEDNEERKYGPPIIQSRSWQWIVLSDNRVELERGTVGGLKRVFGILETPQRNPGVEDTMTATVIEPDQPAEITAKWVVSKFQQVDLYLRANC